MMGQMNIRMTFRSRITSCSKIISYKRHEGLYTPRHSNVRFVSIG